MSTVADAAALTVSQCMRVSPLEHAEVVAGHDGLTERQVRWITVIEGAVEDFIAPGEFVLTTGLDHGAERFADFVREVASSQAAALLVAVGPGAPLPRVPEDARALADAHGLPLIELPWAVRFADVLRALTDRLLSARYAATLDQGDHLPTGFTDALLRRDGRAAIAEALEGTTGRPVVILDPDLAASAHGPLAAGDPAAGTLLAKESLARATDLGHLQALRSMLEDGAVRWLDAVPDLGIPAGHAVAAIAQGSVLGYVLALGTEPREALIVERHALGHAAVAVAIESLRRRAVAEAEARARGDFLWELATEAALTRGELATKAALLGYSVARPYRVLLAQSEDADEDRLDDLARQLRRHGALAGVQAGRRGDRVLALVPTGAPPALQPRALVQRTRGILDTADCCFGLAEGTYVLTEIAEGLRRAERALRVGRTMRASQALADGETLGAFLLLDPIARDAGAQRSAASVIEPLEEYDRRGNRALVETLEAFLEENGNTSSAARRLFLNRHSLMYRLRKIESLTGCDLKRHDDRFLLELSLRLRRMNTE